MAHYRSVGDVPPKRHTQPRQPDGTLYREELMGEEGFSSDSSLLYHRFIPSTIVGARDWPLPAHSLTPNHPLLPRHLKLHELINNEDHTEIDAVSGRWVILGNDQVMLSYVGAGKASPLYRNAVGDECVYVESGAGELETVFGTVSVATGDYVIIPR